VIIEFDFITKMIRPNYFKASKLPVLSAFNFSNLVNLFKFNEWKRFSNWIGLARK
jgi:hypothetical protein